MRRKIMPDEKDGLLHDPGHLPCSPLPEDAVGFDDEQHIVEALIRPLLPEWEMTIGLQQPNAQFRQGLVEAILACTLLKNYTPDRLSDRRKQLMIVSRGASAAVKIIRRLDSNLQQVADCFYPGIFSRFLEVGKQALELEALSSVARGHANSLNADKGGPRGMFAFRRLVVGLAREFESATGRAAKVTWSDFHKCYEGRFIDLVDNVLPIVLELAPNLPHPRTARARGKYIHAVTRERRRKRKVPQPRDKVPSDLNFFD